MDFNLCQQEVLTAVMAKEESMKKLLTLTLALVSVIGFNACGDKPNPNAGAPGGNGPEWVFRGSGAFSGDVKAFYGVGSASGIKNISLARENCEASARRSISATFSTYTAGLTKSYMASTTAGDMSASSEDAMKSFTQSTLNFVEIMDRWFDQANNTWYCLARLDMAKAIDNMNNHKELSAKVRDYVRENASKAFDELEKEAAKHSEE